MKRQLWVAGRRRRRSGQIVDIVVVVNIRRRVAVFVIAVIICANLLFLLLRLLLLLFELEKLALADTLELGRVDGSSPTGSTVVACSSAAGRSAHVRAIHLCRC